MKILINCSNLKVGGGLQVAHSFLYEIKNNLSHDFIVVLSDYLRYQINEADFPNNFHFYHYSIKPSALKALVGNDAFLDALEEKTQPNVVFSVFGPTYWQPNAKHICGFAKPDYIYKNSPYFKQISWWQKVKLSLMEFFHMYDFKNNNECLITENQDVTKILQEKVTQPVYTVTNYFHQIFLNQNHWDKRITLSQPENTIKLLTISANYPHKNLAIIKKVISVLKENFPDFKFMFYLTISRSEFGISEADSLNENITFLGKVTIKQCPSLYQQSDFLFLPTLLECFSASYCEAMVMQKPILTSNLSFAKGICGNAALYFDPLDASDIANKIVDLSVDKDLQNQLKQEGLLQLQKFDNATVRAQKYLELITSEDAITK
jgi:glycosyltransferase involved in cell wall biosynthesis